MEKNPLSTPDGHSLRNMRENSERARKNPGRHHNLFPSSGSTRATPLRSKKFLARFGAPYYPGPNLGPWNCENERSRAENAFSKIIEVVVPYELPDSWEWRGHLLRLAGAPRSGKRLPRAALLPHCDRCLTGAPALDFGHPHVEWKAEHAFWAPKSTKVQYGSNLP